MKKAKRHHEVDAVVDSRSIASKVLQITEAPVLLREKAFEHLRDAIIIGHFAPGDRLIERELCEAMGVSRTLIREVLRQLEAERLITVEPRRGPTVSLVTRKQAAEIYEIRAQLEAILARRFTERASDDDIAKLRRIFEEGSKVRRTGNIPALVAVGARYNAHMIKVAGHELAGEIVQQLTARISFLRVKSMTHPGRIEAGDQEIRDIIAAVERRDADAAAHYTRIYVNNACIAALARLDAEEAMQG